MFQLRFPPSEIAHWAKRYSYAEEDGRVERAGSAARERGYLRRSEFLALCRWKTPRTAKQCASNSPQRIREAYELGRNCVCAPKSSVVVSITAAPAKCGAAA